MCCVCLSVPLGGDAWQCKSCESIIDVACLENVKKKKSNACPICRHGSEKGQKFETNRIGRATKSYFESLVFKCSIGCDQTFKYNLSTDHLNECVKIPYVNCLL